MKRVHTFYRAVALFNEGLINIAGMITHRFSLEEWGEALRVVAGVREHVKVVIIP